MIGSFYRVARIASCLGGLIVGHLVFPITSTTAPGATRSIMRTSNQMYRTKAAEWDLQEGLFTPSEIVTRITPLLLAVLAGLGQDPQGHLSSSKKLLLENLANSLATDSRESTLPLKGDQREPAQQEIQAQANNIGMYLVEQARKLDLDNPNLNIDIRSPCEGHLWTRAVANLLMGPRSNGQLMQIFNEYLHQMVLLRDALLPFENYQDVQFHIKKSKSGCGLRKFERVRSTFLVDCLTRTVSQKSLIEVAKIFTAADLPPGGYGFQYSGFAVLPAFLFGSSSTRLLRFFPAQIEKSDKPILFDYEYPDYYTAQKSEISQDINFSTSPVATGASSSAKYSLTLEKFPASPDSRRVLKLGLDLPDGSCVAVDVGQAARGWRYSAHLPHRHGNGQSSTTHTQEKRRLIHTTDKILALPGLVSSINGDTHVISATDPLARLALLGKIYPHNVFVAGGTEGVAEAESFPEKFGGRFVIVGDDSAETEAGDFARLLKGGLRESL